MLKETISKRIFATESDVIAYILLTVTMVIWGSTWPLGRLLVTDASDFPQLMIAAIRYYIVVPVFLLILRMKEGSFQIQFLRENLVLLLIMGTISVTIYQAGYLFGESYTSASDASLIVATSPIWVLLITTILFRYQLDWKKIAGVLLGFTGVLIIVGFSPNVNVENRMLGNAWILVAAVSYATYTVLLKEIRNKYSTNAENKASPLAVVTWVSVLGALTLLPVSFYLNPEYLSIDPYLQIPGVIWFGILYLAFLSTILGFLTYIEGVNRLDPNRAVIFVNLIPLIGIALSGLFLGEKIDIVVHSISFGLIAFGVILVNRKRTKNNQIADGKLSST